MNMSAPVRTVAERKSGYLAGETLLTRKSRVTIASGASRSHIHEAIVACDGLEVSRDQHLPFMLPGSARMSCAERTGVREAEGDATHNPA